LSKWRARFRFYHVPTKENEADWPSRDHCNASFRLARVVFNQLWRLYGPFDLDLMSSLDPDTKKILPYFSRGPDPQSSGLNALAQELTPGSNIYCYPPLAMINLVVKLCKRDHVRGVIVIPVVIEPSPVWFGAFARCVTSVLDLPEGCTQERKGDRPFHRKRIQLRLRAYRFDFS
jgi:hypothetical protein